MKLSILVSCRELAEARLILEGISAAIDGDIKGVAEDLSATLKRRAQPRSDVLLLENRCCDPASRKMLLRLPSLLRSTRVLLLCDKYTTEMLLEFISIGVSGCLPRNADFPLLVKAVRSVHRGQTWFDRSSMVQAIRRQTCQGSCPYQHPREYDRLTSRENEMLDCIGAGMSNKEIASKLQISVSTVQTVLHRIYSKLKVSGRYKVLTALSSPAAKAPPWRMREAGASAPVGPAREGVFAERSENMSFRCGFMQEMPECPYK